jgi:phospholipid-binding lipoprotein MlaA
MTSLTICRPIAAMLFLALLAGCATTKSAPSPADPWERVNRTTYAFNDGLDRAVLKPVAKGYRKVVPQFARTGVTNFLTNLAYPTTIVNDLLQLKLMAAVSDTTRFVINSSFGLGGLLDPATHANLPRNDEDFGQTLGHWGVPSGPYLVLPFLGPSTLRDTPSLYADYLTDGRHYIGDSKIGFAFAGLSIVDLRARLIPAEKAISGAYDPYALIRNAYLDRREYQVRDGKVEESDGIDPSLFEDAGLDVTPGQATGPGK